MAESFLRPLFSVLLLALLTVFFPACATVPETGRKQMVFFGEEMERSQSEREFAQYKRRNTVNKNAALNERVQRIGSRVVRVTPAANKAWEFVIFEDSDPNAFALPSGKVGINSGIFSVATSDAMLAAVISHEISHVIARHGAERATHGTIATVSGALLEIGLAVATDISPLTRAAIVGAVGAGATLGVILPYSRAHEHEADRMGLIYMARAGYNPEAAVEFWKRMMAASKKKKGLKLPSFLSTHPVDESRIKRLEKWMPQAQDEYLLAKQKN